MRANRSSGSLLVFLLLVAASASPAGAEPETMVVDLRVAGSMDQARRTSGNYSMYVEDWTTHSRFSQSSQFMLVREPTGRMAGAPIQLYRMGSPDRDIYGPMPSPVEDHQISGEVKVSGCLTRTDPVTSGIKMPAGLTLPPGISVPQNMPSQEFGIFFFDGCAGKDLLLVFYMPPKGMFSAPAVGPIKCTPDWAYQVPLRPWLQYQPHLLEAKFAAALSAACPGYAPPVKAMAFMGAVSWHDVLSGTPIRMEKTFEGAKGSPTAKSESIKQTLKLVLEIARPMPCGGPSGKVQCGPPSAGGGVLCCKPEEKCELVPAPMCLARCGPGWCRGNETCCDAASQTCCHITSACCGAGHCCAKGASCCDPTAFLKAARCCSANQECVRDAMTMKGSCCPSGRVCRGRRSTTCCSEGQRCDQGKCV